MDELLKTLSKYSLLNYLIPGAIFVGLLRLITSFDLVQEELVVSLFIYYFVGMVISRFGSVIVEPFLKVTNLIHFAPYSDYVAGSKADPKIIDLSETNNLYRTMIAMIIMLLLSMLAAWANKIRDINQGLQFFLLLLFLFVLFLFSYRKQTKFVKKRIEIAKNEHD